MNLEEIFSHWQTKTSESKTSQQYDLSNKSEWLVKINNIRAALEQLEITSETEEIRSLLKEILRKQLYATGLLLIGSIINEGDANDLQQLKKLIIKIKKSENFDNTWPGTIYDIIKNKYPSIQRLSGAEKLCLNTLGELFGKIHTNMPIYNACSRNVLESLGYSQVSNYQDFQKSFEDFKQEYQKKIGKITGDEFPINVEIDQLFNYFDKDEHGKNFLISVTKPINYWIWSTTPESWKVVKEKNIWASRREKINEKIHSNDIVIFYVTGTGEFQGIYKFSGVWYDVPSTIWRETADQDVLKEIKLEPIAIGNIKVYDVAKSLDFFPNTDDKKLINIILQGGGGYPSNKGKPISKKDYLTILNSMLSETSIMSSETLTQNSSKELLSSILWKKLTETDFNAINGQSNQTQSGGGARHIALGTNNTIDIASFLEVELHDQPIEKEIESYFLNTPSKLTFRWNPQRRGGEWVIADQASNRHPAWNPQNQFPTTYDENNAPIIYIAKTNTGKFHTRFISGNHVNALDIPDSISNEWTNASPGDKGINRFSNINLDDETISILDQLKSHHNILLYGPPGTGKTHFMQQLFSYFENNDAPIIEFDLTEIINPFIPSALPLPSISKWLTFHQSYSYEEFILGLRPEPTTNGMTLKPKAGILLEVSENIKTNKGSAILFIDEINRANISSVFGEFITAIEPDKRLNPNGSPNPGKTIPINLSYLGKNDEVKFADDSHIISNPYSFPYHIYVVASMNSLDRSVTPIDSALARRFFRINIEPNYTALQNQLGLPKSDYDTPNTPEEVAIMLLKRVNMIISAVLGDDFQFGHSYFWNIRGTDEEKWKSLADSFEGNIFPQLKELFRSQPETLGIILKINEGSVPPAGYPYKKDKESQKLISTLDMEISPAIINTPFSYPISDEIKNSFRFLARKTP